MWVGCGWGGALLDTLVGLPSSHYVIITHHNIIDVLLRYCGSHQNLTLDHVHPVCKVSAGAH
jgi:hypothetical protein